MNWTRDRVLAEFRRLARGGKPPGLRAFLKSVPERAWRGRYWARFSDLVREAGFEPNAKQLPQDPAVLFEKFAAVIRRLGRWPTESEQQIERRTKGGFPSVTIMRARFGSQGQIIERFAEWCASRPDLADVEDMLRSTGLVAMLRAASAGSALIGYVYLKKSGRFYKIGKTNHLGRRDYEQKLLLPESLKTIHTIETDDPAGIEAYWHKRFEDKRKGGEWFDLSAADVAAFKRRKKFM